MPRQDGTLTPDEFVQVVTSLRALPPQIVLAVLHACLSEMQQRSNGAAFIISAQQNPSFFVYTERQDIKARLATLLHINFPDIITKPIL